MMRSIVFFILLTGASFAQTFDSSPKTRDRFLDERNLILLGGLTVSHGLDAYKTELTLDGGGRETWPVARHFCQTRQGRIAYFTADYVSTIGTSYLLYRTGHRKLARAVLLVGGVSSSSGFIFTLMHTH